MAQHDANIADAAGLPLRLDINDALSAMFSNSAGATPPTVTRAGQLWFDNHDTVIATLWIRNNANSAWIRLFDLSDTGVTAIGFANLDDVKTLNGGPLQGLRNAVINGNFDIWQRSTIQTSSATASADKWLFTHSTSTKTVSRQPFAPGQTDVPGNPKYFCRVAVETTGNISNNYVIAENRIEGVDTFAGKLCTYTLYAKADSPKNIAIEFGQSYGTGGTPTAGINSVGMHTLALTTAWKRFSFTVDIPSIAGKVLGTNNNDYLRCTTWFDGGTGYDSRNNALGSQTGVFDIAHYSLVEGDATLENDPFSPRPFEQELALAQRYFETSYGLEVPLGTIGYAGNTQMMIVNMATGTLNSATLPFLFKTRKRTTPTMTFYSGMTGASGMGTSFVGTDVDVAASALSTGEQGASVLMADTRSTSYFNLSAHWAAAAEI